MKLGRALSTFGKHAALSLGYEPAGRSLLDDLASDDENVRMLAGMFLTRNGRRSLPVLREALARGEQVPTILTILGGIPVPESAELIRRYLDDPEFAETARMAMDVWTRNAR